MHTRPSLPVAIQSSSRSFIPQHGSLSVSLLLPPGVPTSLRSIALPTNAPLISRIFRDLFSHFACVVRCQIRLSKATAGVGVGNVSASGEVSKGGQHSVFTHPLSPPPPPSLVGQNVEPGARTSAPQLPSAVSSISTTPSSCKHTSLRHSSRSALAVVRRTHLHRLSASNRVSTGWYSTVRDLRAASVGGL